MSPQVGLSLEKYSGIDGVDVSAIQALIDYPRVVRDGARFAWVKAGGGPRPASSTNPHGTPAYGDAMRTIHHHGFSSAGARAGFYYFFKPWADPVQQAAHFASLCSWKTGDLPPMMDLEVWDDRLPDFVEAAARVFLIECDRLFGVQTVTYSYMSFLMGLAKPALVSPGFWKGRIIAEAAYDGGPVTVAPFDPPKFFQFDGNEGVVHGVSDRLGRPIACDRDRFLGSYDELVRVCGEEPPQPTTVSDDARVRGVDS